MHPSIALEVAKRQLEEDEGRPPRPANEGDSELELEEEENQRPAPFLHFGPRWHQRRRTMTGVLAGYFDPPPRNAPLPFILGAQDLLTRTAAPAVTEEDLDRMESERRRAEAANAKRARPGSSATRAKLRREADIISGIIVAETNRNSNSNNRSTSRSDSPLTTDFKLVSDESTPPLTPMSSRSEISIFGTSHDKSKDASSSHPPRPSKHSASAATPATAKPPKPAKAKSTNSGQNNAPPKKATVQDILSKKRKHSEMEKPLQRPREMTNNRPKPKTRPGWKGWVEVEGSPEPQEKLISLDKPVETLEKRTRSGKVVPPTVPIPIGRSRKTSAAETPKSPDETSGTSVPATDGPLTSLDANEIVTYNGSGGGEEV